jgi:hypothetical protein
LFRLGAEEGEINGATTHGEVAGGGADLNVHISVLLRAQIVYYKTRRQHVGWIFRRIRITFLKTDG